MVKVALLKQRKKELNLSYDDIAERSGCARVSIVRILNGITPCPRIDTLQKIAEVLELPIEELTTGNDYKVTEPLVQTLTPFKQPDIILTDEEQRLVEAFRCLGPTMRASTLNMIESAVASTQQSRNRNIR